ncbi:MAG: chorismate synthase [Clostridium sp.]|nr:chorismate synthase [Prevotella sp.]MCM1428622.1 chorismate synthase [Clostridium sp.]MCM1475751.1 chorismate synthase [Muribaculaceae bacterium]
MNTIGKNLTLTTFGESHGPVMGGVLDGFPPGLNIDFPAIDALLALRRPGSSSLVSSRSEPDVVEFLSGISQNGISLGTPIAFIIRNRDVRSNDYAEIAECYRPNHADFTYMARYGIRDFRGGGRASARDTVSRVVAGALALQWLKSKGVAVDAWIDDEEALRGRVETARNSGDSVGGIVCGKISGLSAGLGDPVFGKVQSQLAAALMAVNAVMGFEFGCGFRASGLSGSQMADTMSTLDSPNRLIRRDGVAGDLPVPHYDSNNCGGLNGGITNGEDITFRLAFKPTPTIHKPLKTVDTEGCERIICADGRHDPCVALRAVPVVKAVSALVAADILLSDKRSLY